MKQLSFEKRENFIEGNSTRLLIRNVHTLHILDSRDSRSRDFLEGTRASGRGEREREERRGPYRINSSGGIGRGWKRGKALRPRRDRGFVPPTVASQSLSARCTRRCVEKNPASRLSGTRVANAYTRRARFPGVTAPEALPSCSLVNPADKCEKKTRRDYIEPMTISGAVFMRAVYSRMNSLGHEWRFKLYRSPLLA